MSVWKDPGIGVTPAKSVIGAPADVHEPTLVSISGTHTHK